MSQIVIDSLQSTVFPQFIWESHSWGIQHIFNLARNTLYLHVKQTVFIYGKLWWSIWKSAGCGITLYNRALSRALQNVEHSWLPPNKYQQDTPGHWDKNTIQIFPMVLTHWEPWEERGIKQPRESTAKVRDEKQWGAPAYSMLKGPCLLPARHGIPDWEGQDRRQPPGLSCLLFHMYECNMEVPTHLYHRGRSRALVLGAAQAPSVRLVLSNGSLTVGLDEWRKFIYVCLFTYIFLWKLLNNELTLWWFLEKPTSKGQSLISECTV